MYLPLLTIPAVLRADNGSDSRQNVEHILYASPFAVPRQEIGADYVRDVLHVGKDRFRVYRAFGCQHVLTKKRILRVFVKLGFKYFEEQRYSLHRVALLLTRPTQVGQIVQFNKVVQKPVEESEGVKRVSERVWDQAITGASSIMRLGVKEGLWMQRATDRARKEAVTLHAHVFVVPVAL